jgi:hypothetical protein
MIAIEKIDSAVKMHYHIIMSLPEVEEKEVVEG